MSYDVDPNNSSWQRLFRQYNIYLESKQYNTDDADPAVQTVQVWDVGEVVEVKHRLETDRGEYECPRLDPSMHQLNIQLRHVPEHAVRQDRWTAQQKSVRFVKQY